MSRDTEISRRVGRMELLVTDLSQIQPGHNPPALELTRARGLQAALEAVYGLAPEAPEPKADKAPDKGKTGKK